MEAIEKCDVMVYTKIFLKFPYKFWPCGHEQRGYYTFWQKDNKFESKASKGATLNELVELTGCSSCLFFEVWVLILYRVTSATAFLKDAWGLKHVGAIEQSNIFYTAEFTPEELDSRKRSLNLQVIRFAAEPCFAHVLPFPKVNSLGGWHGEGGSNHPAIFKGLEFSKIMLLFFLFSAGLRWNLMIMRYCTVRLFGYFSHMLLDDGV
ncbi:hypothetical protein TEA_002511 [Camellia sinensis var. sinensis]|uniref:Uncharacterized protein n=1 Tax=Camellia sinensis var. sinensis TaxID=542762 RepID=A0A4S4EIY6_CAMSN|nr:hypothetical protein TEA_002511 [Camellia sinensis var. sinensis]